jgi:hypothetical protein
LAKKPWQPFAFGGVHRCELCQFDGEQAATANLFIPYRDKMGAITPVARCAVRRE